MYKFLCIAALVALTQAGEKCDIEKITKCAEESFPDFSNLLQKILSHPELLQDATFDSDLLQTLCENHLKFIDCLGGKDVAEKCLVEAISDASGHHEIEEGKFGKALFESVEYICAKDTLDMLKFNMGCLISFYQFQNTDPQIQKCIEEIGGDFQAQSIDNPVCKVLPVGYNKCFRPAMEKMCGPKVSNIFCGLIDTQKNAFECKPVAPTCP